MVTVQVHSQLQNEDGEEVYDSLKKAVVGIDIAHAEIHSGDSYETSYKSPEGTDIADNATIVLHLYFGSRPAHFTFAVAGGGDTEIELIEVVLNPGDVVNNGAPLDVFNMNRVSGDETEARAYQGSTTTGTERRMRHTFSPGGTKNQAQGGTTREGTEWILRPLTHYFVRGTNRAGNAQSMSVEGQWYE